MYRSHNLKGRSGAGNAVAPFREEELTWFTNLSSGDGASPSRPHRARAALLPESGGRVLASCSLLSLQSTEVASGGWGGEDRNSQQANARARRRLPCWAEGWPGGQLS